MISQTVNLLFDPEADSGEIKEIFSDDVARTLWLAVKQSHVAGKHFKSAILRYAALIKDLMEKGDLDARKLFYILSGSFAPDQAIIGSCEQAFAEELLPFIKGEKAITFKIKTFAEKKN